MVHGRLSRCSGTTSLSLYLASQSLLGHDLSLSLSLSGQSLLAHDFSLPLSLSGQSLLGHALRALGDEVTPHEQTRQSRYRDK